MRSLLRQRLPASTARVPPADITEAAELCSAAVPMRPVREPAGRRPGPYQRQGEVEPQAEGCCPIHSARRTAERLTEPTVLRPRLADPRTVSLREVDKSDT